MILSGNDNKDYFVKKWRLIHNMKNALCSIKGCNYKASEKTILEQREYRLCPKHIYLHIIPWHIIGEKE